MEFELLLPEDEQPIDARTARSAQWCQGFLYGLGTSAVQDAERAARGSRRDRARPHGDQPRRRWTTARATETNESAYAELVEFVRVGVQLVFEELEPLRDQPRTAGGSPALKPTRPSDRPDP